ncbi:HD domain-containing phosphohydrolase [Desulfosarcina variabilis]|uniref:HD domain-containing phosphohydrolase n=1 Tax=Desulfosarcina variabilis TaxID=2300 RepID=UPI003AFAA32D
MATERLVIQIGPMKGKSFAIQERMSIGRSPNNTIQLDDIQVSRQHAVIQRVGHDIILRDLGSCNGTYIGGKRIIECRLNVGDVIRIGRHELCFQVTTKASPSVIATPKRNTNREDERSTARFSETVISNIKTMDVTDVSDTLFETPPAETFEYQLQYLQKRLKAVFTANQIIASDCDLNSIFKCLMDQIFALLPVDNGVILLMDQATGEWVQEHAQNRLSQKKITVSSTIVNRAYEKGEAILTSNAAADARFCSSDSIIIQNIASTMCVPLSHKNIRLGIVYVDTHGRTNAFDERDLKLLAALAGPAAISIRNAQYVREIEKSYENTLVVIANAIELRDHYTVGHTARVTNFSVEIARELGWTGNRLKQVRMGGLLHDVGKIAVDNAILSKPSSLTPQEYAKIKVHPQRGQDLLQDVEFLHPLIPFCLYHHERYDGRGYPFGLARDKIPIEGRIIAVADTLDAMTSNRPYRKGMKLEVALAELKRGVGSQFDPDCVKALLRAYRAGRIHRHLQNYHTKNEKSIVCPFCSSAVPISRKSSPGDQFVCHVCGRKVCLVEKNDAYYGKLIPQISPHSTSEEPVLH